jgi:1-acyl-sn-glycerol-3-phosphate acyltransferase
MFEPVEDVVRAGLRRWTESLAGGDLEERLRHVSRPENEYGVDPFGFSLDYTLSAVAPLLWLYRHYHRVKVTGIERVPPGRVLLVANHSGQLPMDGAMIGVAMLVEGHPPRAIRSMVERWVPSLPWVSTFMARVGQVVGTPENCRRLLSSGEAILVFPEGTRGISKPFSKRYQLQPFGLGFLRLALETDTPVLPVAVVGAEEQAPALANVRPLARALGFPAFPITPTLLPIPLPSRYHLLFGEPMHLSGRADDDDGVLERKADTVKAAVRALLDRGLSERRSIYF